ncbi:MAG: LytTR family transcriptional regulator [Alphaproteobacteria bacterium]|nr:LytTR family transcriptional regulator [Alphaproteobacteria bacterium]
MIRIKKIYYACLPTRNDRFLWAVVSVVTLAIMAVNALSQLTDAQRRGDELPAYVPWITEATSICFIIILFPILAFIVRRLPLSAETMKKTVLCHIGLSVAFSAVHVAGMVGLRKVIFSVIYGHHYQFFDIIWRDALYEYRKDIVTYLLFITILYLTQALTKRDEALEQVTRQVSHPQKRLSFKSGSDLIWITLAGFSHAKAAGNYVELTADGTTHLIRVTLAALEKQLAGENVPVARTHRSYIVNANHIVAVKPKSDGDANIILKCGTLVPASRRFRANIPSHS